MQSTFISVILKPASFSGVLHLYILFGATNTLVSDRIKFRKGIWHNCIQIFVSTHIYSIVKPETHYIKLNSRTLLAHLVFKRASLIKLPNKSRTSSFVR